MNAAIARVLLRRAWERRMDRLAAYLAALLSGGNENAQDTGSKTEPRRGQHRCQDR